MEVVPEAVELPALHANDAADTLHAGVGVLLPAFVCRVGEPHDLDHVARPVSVGEGAFREGFVRPGGRAVPPAGTGDGDERVGQARSAAHDEREQRLLELDPGGPAKGRRGKRRTVVTLKAVEKLRPARDEIIVATGLSRSGGMQAWGSWATGLFVERRQRG